MPKEHSSSMALTERALVFRTLARAFAYPLEGRALETREALCALAWTAAADETGRHVRDAKDAWRSVSDIQLVADYRRLFDANGPVSLHETAYNKPSMAGRAIVLADINGLYQAFGFSYDRSDLPDRLETELDFVSVLLLKERYARTNGLKAQDAVAARAITVFLQQHLGRWVAAFVHAIAVADPETPYYPMAKLLAVAVLRECRQRRVRCETASRDMSPEVA